MATVELRGLAKRFGGFTALEGLDLSIEDGEFLALLGPSGCGESTTMRLVAGLEEPSEGDILIGGERVNDLPARRRDLAMVFQNYALYPHMSVGENVAYPLKVAGLSRRARAERARDGARKVEMEHLMNRRPGELSGGQRQRVALARAIVRTPQLFPMDEPLSNRDAKLRTLMRGELRHLQKALATTTIHVTHDRVEAMTLADRIVILDDARIQQMGTPAETHARPANAFAAGFVGSPPMNLIEGEVAGGAFAHAGGRVAVPGAPDGPATLGVRPEDLSLAAGSEGILGEVWTSELLGDSTLLAARTGGALVSAKLGPTEGREIGSPVALAAAQGKVHLFGPGGERMAWP